MAVTGEHSTVNLENGGDLNGNLRGDGIFNFNGGSFSIMNGNSDLSATITIKENVDVTAHNVEALGKEGVVSLDGALSFVNASGDFSNQLEGDGNIDIAASSDLVFTADNTDFTGNVTLDGTLTVEDESNLGKSGDDGVAYIGTGSLIFDFTDSQIVDQSISSEIDIIKEGAGDAELTENSLQSTGSITVNEGIVSFDNGTSDDNPDGFKIGTSEFIIGSGDDSVKGGLAAYGDLSSSSVILNKGGTIYADYDNRNGIETLNVKETVNNGGIIQIGDLKASGSADIGNKYITGNYVGGADKSDAYGIAVNVYVDGNDSKADQFIITGSASGTVNFELDSANFFGNTSERIGINNGIVIGQAGSGNADYTMDAVNVGGQWFRLMKGDNGELFLISQGNKPTDPEADSVDDVKDEASGAASMLAYVASQAFDLSLRDHVGERLYVDPITGQTLKTSLWMVQSGTWMEGSDSSGALDSDGSVYTTQVGADLYTLKVTDNSRLHLGVLGGYSYASFDTDSASTGYTSKGSFDGWSIGAYALWQTENEYGPYVGAQVRYNSFDVDITPDGMDTESLDISGMSVGLEAGWDQLITKGVFASGTDFLWRVQPQIRMNWTSFDFDSFSSANGNYRIDDTDNITLRVGARTTFTIGDMDEFQTPAVQFVLEANWIHNNEDFETLQQTKFGMSSADFDVEDALELRVGAEMQIMENVQFWGDFRYQNGDNNYESLGFTVGGKYIF